MGGLGGGWFSFRGWFRVWGSGVRVYLSGKGRGGKGGEEGRGKGPHQMERLSMMCEGRQRRRPPEQLTSRSSAKAGRAMFVSLYFFTACSDCLSMLPAIAGIVVRSRRTDKPEPEPLSVDETREIGLGVAGQISTTLTDCRERSTGSLSRRAAAREDGVPLSRGALVGEGLLGSLRPLMDPLLLPFDEGMLRAEVRSGPSPMSRAVTTPPSCCCCWLSPPSPPAPSRQPELAGLLMGLLLGASEADLDNPSPLPCLLVDRDCHRGLCMAAAPTKEAPRAQKAEGGCSIPP